MVETGQVQYQYQYVESLLLHVVGVPLYLRHYYSRGDTVEQYELLLHNRYSSTLRIVLVQKYQ
jgi:hypothetical protein